jgi:pimeloyl-ACP methyl ester carboxylesterase
MNHLLWNDIRTPVTREYLSPLDNTGRRLSGLIEDVQLGVIEGGPHAIPWTHADQVDTALLDFLRSEQPAQQQAPDIDHHY